MDVVTIPRNLVQEDDLVVIPRREYEEFLELKKVIPIVKATPSELRAIRRSEKEIREGKYISWHELKRELASTRYRRRRQTNKTSASQRQRPS